MTATPHHPLPAVLTETTLTPAEAAVELSTTRQTVGRWLTAGFRVGGCVVRLEGTMVGGRWKTSREAVGRFLAACETARRPAPTVSPAERRRRDKRADRELKRMGV